MLASRRPGTGSTATITAAPEMRAPWITGVTLPVESGVLSVTPLMMAPHLRAVPTPVLCLTLTPVPSRPRSWSP